MNRIKTRLFGRNGKLLLAILLAILPAIALSTLFLRAQGATATISGAVADQNDATIPGTLITMTNVNTNLQRQTTTNQDGQFTIPLLPPGTYTITAQRDGFAPFRIPDLMLNVNDQRSISIQLRVSDVAERTVQIDSTDTVNTSPSVGTVVDQQFVKNLPLNGRTFQSLFTLTPGVVLTKATGSDQGQFSVNGQRADANYATVDGVSANVGVSGNFAPGQAAVGALPGLTVTGGSNNLVSVDALQEFQIQTSTYAPEFGRTPGAQVSLITRSGTNEFHGSLFEYFRNDVLDANDWFANSLGIEKQALRQNIFGLVLGGPVYLPRIGQGGPNFYSGKNRTFFFFSYEGQRIRRPLIGITDVPGLSERQNAPATIQPYLNAFPLPTGPDRADGFAQFAAGFSNPSTVNATSFRIDHTIGSKVNLFGRYNNAPSTTTQRGGAGFNSLNNLSNIRFKTETLTFGSTFLFTSRITDDLRINFSRNTADSTFTLDNFGGAVVPSESLFFPSFASRNDSLYNFSLSNGLNSIYQVGRLTGSKQRQFNIVNSLSMVTGSHQLKFGVDYRRLTPVISNNSYIQQPVFSDVSQVLAGVPFLVAVINTSGPRELLFNNFSLFGQDTWQATRQLTLTYGLRYEVNPPPTETKGNHPAVITGLNDPSTMTLAPYGTPLYHTTYNNFAPRVGAAFRLSETPGRETVLRGGFGIFYDLGTTTAALPFGSGAFPYTAQTFLINVPYPLTPEQAAPPPISRNLPAPTGTVVVAFDPDLKLPRTYQWNAAIEQSLGSNQTISLSYVGAAGRRLLRQQRLLNPNPNFPTVDVTTNQATSDYNALQIQFQRRLSRGLQTHFAYTWAKSLDNLSTDAVQTAPTTRIDPQTDRGPSDFDIRHAFNAALTYDIPTFHSRGIVNALLRNFSVDSMVAARSASPVNITIQRNIGFGFYEFRPDVVPGVPIYVDDPSAPGGWHINNTRSATDPRQVGPFVIPTAPRQGSLGRNSLRGFPLFQVDLGLRRQFNLTERLNLQLKAEAFNILNHPNFGDPFSSLGFDFGSGVFIFPPFGQSFQMFGRSLGSGGVLGGLNPLYQVGGPRSIQLSVKLQF